MIPAWFQLEVSWNAPQWQISPHCMVKLITFKTWSILCWKLSLSILFPLCLRINLSTFYRRVYQLKHTHTPWNTQTNKDPTCQRWFNQIRSGMTSEKASFVGWQCPRRSVIQRTFFQVTYMSWLSGLFSSKIWHLENLKNCFAREYIWIKFVNHS